MAKAVVLLFPGQGAQVVGMGVALAEKYPVVADWYAEAEEACGLPLRQIIAEGPNEKLLLTEIQQPALLMVEIGAYLALQQHVKPRVVVALGHSLGEYAALVAAGALDRVDAVRLVRHRGRYMQDAVPLGVGGMMAVLGLRGEQINRLCEEFAEADARAWLSNDNCSGQIVVSGHIKALKRLGPILKELGAKRVVPLAVSAPFHCPLMEPAAEALAEDLAQLEFKKPQFPVIANFSAEPYRDAAAVPLGLRLQVEAPVRFRESLAAVQQYEPDFVLDLGPRPVISGLAKRTIPQIPILQVSNPENVAAAAKVLA